MYYVLLPKEMVERRHIFEDMERLPEPDGRTPVTLRDLSYLSFSLGMVEIVNDSDLKKIIRQLTAKESSTNDKED